MLKKLLKYDFRAMFNVLLPGYAILIFLSLFNRMSEVISNKVAILKIPAGFIFIIYVIILIGVPMATFITSITNYYKNLAGDEGYLMHTLPVTKKDLVLSKLIAYFVTIIISVIVSIVGLFIGEYGIKFDLPTLNSILDTLKSFDALTFIMIIISVVLTVIFQQLLIYASIALGQKQSTNKAIFSIIFGVILYYANQIISALILLIPMLFNKDLWRQLHQQKLSPNILNGYLGGSVILSILFIIGYFILTTKTLEKNLNLE
jgi:hypothetical protein